MGNRDDNPTPAGGPTYPAYTGYDATQALGTATPASGATGLPASGTPGSGTPYGVASGMSPPAWIGPYRILETIGEGGMGVVYRAEQSHPIQRVVALKLIRAGMESPDALARFEAERQALALMDHPNVARIHDAGTTAEGRPFFVMEFVAGEPITRYADRQRLDTRARLGLFVQACEALQHAHTKAVLHRDIKPSNILVTEVEGKPVVKVIDFGVAKAAEGRLTERTLHTEAGRLIGTPEYMSPEQAQLGTLDVDTRTDIYSLGVVLYELLSGAQPFDAKTLRSASFDEMRRMIREVEPPRPSTRVSSLAGEDARRVVESRRTTAASLRAELRGELEWIPLKAMRKDPAERYRSAAELADDVRNYLDGRPLLAGPETAAYRLRKFVRKHVKSVATAAAAVLVLVGLLVVLALAWREARSAWREAEKERLAADEARGQAERSRDEARREARLANAVRFLQAAQAMYAGPAGPGPKKGPPPTVVAPGTQPSKGEHRPPDPHGGQGAQRGWWMALDRAVGRAERLYAADDPQLFAAICHVAGWECLQRARYDDAGRFLARALAVREAKLGPADPDTLETVRCLGELALARDEVAEAESLLRRAAEGQARALGADHLWARLAALALSDALVAADKLTEAEPLLLATIPTRLWRYEDRLDYVGASAAAAAGPLRASERALAEAERLYESELAKRRARLGELHPRTTAAASLLAAVYWHHRRHQEAVALLHGVFKSVSANHDPDSRVTANSVAADLAALFEDAGKLREAAQVYGAVVRMNEALMGPESRSALVAREAAQRVRERSGWDEQVLRERARLLDLQLKALGEQDVLVRRSMQALARGQLALKQSPTAVAMAQDTVERAMATAPPAGPVARLLREAESLFWFARERAAHPGPVEATAAVPSPPVPAPPVPAPAGVEPRPAGPPPTRGGGDPPVPAAVAGVPATGPAVAEAGPAAMELMDVRGMVEVKEHDGAPWKRATPRMVLRRGATLRTGPDGFARLSAAGQRQQVTVRRFSQVRFEIDGLRRDRGMLQPGDPDLRMEDANRDEEGFIRGPNSALRVRG